MFKQSRILILSLLGGIALCGASTATAQVETCEVALLLGEVDRQLCNGAEDSRQPVLCARGLVERGLEPNHRRICWGTRNARLTLKCLDNNQECANRFTDPKYEPAVYEEDTCSLPNAKQLGPHLPKNINLNDLKRIIK